MIHNLCNLVDENNLDTFYKILIAEASALPVFDNLTPKEEVLGILNSLPDSYQAMVVPFLPEKLGLSSNARPRNSEVGWQHSISFPLVPQDTALQELLESYNNREVVALITRLNQSQLYGTQAQPLVFSYGELHSPNATGLKGFNIGIQGDTYAPALYFAGTEADFPVLNRGLAFTLAGTL